jgi:SAM-dependent methyltransferase
MNDNDRSLQRVAPDDPEYMMMAAKEAEFWEKPHPYGMESLEEKAVDGPPDFYTNERFTGHKHLHWEETIRRWGPFRRGLVLGTSALVPEARILSTNPLLQLTFVDISEGAVKRRARELGPRFPGRVSTLIADLNFAEFEAGAYDAVISSSSLHHVTNLEFCAWQVNRALTPGGYFFLHDYVGEKRFEFSEYKKRLYETIHGRQSARIGRTPGVAWHDSSDLSPFCGVRSDEMLAILATCLDPVDVRVASAIAVCTLRSHSEHRDPPRSILPRIVAKIRRRAQRVSFAPRLRQPVDRTFLNELTLIGDILTEAGVVLPAAAFGVYRKRV